MAKAKSTNSDILEREQASLGYVLRQEKEEVTVDNTPYVSAAVAMREKSLLEFTSARDVTRVLFISRDDSLLNPEKQSLDGYVSLSDLFAEVHILILRKGIEAINPVLRVAPNVWIYTATAKDFWRVPFKANKLILNQLVFAEGFRPDVIVARDPFESAALALYLGRKYKRPVQCHVLEDYDKEEFLTKEPENKWRKKMLQFTLPRFASIRTSTGALRDKVMKRTKAIDVAVLPRFNNYESLMMATPDFDVKNIFPNYVFTILYIGKLDHNSLFHKALDAARFGLRSPKIGLLVIGEGKARKEFEERAAILGVKEQVSFLGKIKDEISYLKTANVLIVTDTDPESEEIALRGAAAGIPLILSKTPIREDLFVDGKSAMLCDPTEIDHFSLKLNMLMNDFMLRRNLALGAVEVVRTKLHEDPESYLRAYRTSIEAVLFLEPEDKKADKD